MLRRLLGEQEIGALLPLKDKWWERNRFLPSGKSNLGQFAQDGGKKPSGNAGTGKHAQRRYRSQHHFIIYMREAENHRTPDWKGMPMIICSNLVMQ